MLLSVTRKVLKLMTPHRNCRKAGFTLVEVALTIVVVLGLLAYGIPKMQTVIYNYQLDAAVDSCSWALQATRYQAVQMGYPYQVAFNASTNSYQVLNDTTYPTTPITFSNVGNSVPITPSGVVISASNTIQFSPSGLVTAVGSSSLTFTVSYQGLPAKTITVSPYGQVHVQ